MQSDGRGRVEHAPERVEVVGQVVVGQGLDQQPGPVRLQRAADVPGGAHGIAHVVQGVEDGDKIEVLAREVLAAERGLEIRAVADPGFRRDLGCVPSRSTASW